LPVYLKLFFICAVLISIENYAQHAEIGYPLNETNLVDSTKCNVTKFSEVDDESYNLRKPSEEKIKRLLQDEELNYFQNPEIEKNWIEKIYDWINRRIQSLFQSKLYSDFIDYLIYLIMGLSLLIIIIGLLKSDVHGFLYGKKPKKISGVSEETEDISKIDFDELIAQSIRKNDYKLAIRYNYLKILFLLSNSGLIELREFKTSGQFLNELKDPGRFLKPFKLITQIFENTWYGDYKVEAELYQSIENKFHQLQKLIREA